MIAAMLDFLTFAVCAPYSETTDGKHFDFLLKLLAANGRVLYQLFRHPSLAVVKVGIAPAVALWSQLMSRVMLSYEASNGTSYMKLAARLVI